MSAPDPIAERKAELRKQCRARRDALPVVEQSAAAQTVAARGLPVPVPSGAIVSGYSPLKFEISPLPLMRRAADRGAQLALPVVQGRGTPLIMRAWSFGEALGSGVWGIREPKPEAPEVFPDILIVVTAIGIAFAAQEIPDVPKTPRDARLDLVLTEREIIDLRD